MIGPAILAAGMMTGVGLNAPASCAAIRAGINNFAETRFRAQSGDWIVGSEVLLEESWRGFTKLAKMAASAVAECLEALSQRPMSDSSPPLVLCVAEEDRPGRLPGLDDSLILDIERELDVKFHMESSVVAQGRVGGAIGLLRAQQLIQERGHANVILVGVDTYLTGETIGALEGRNRLLTSDNSDGFIPGEGAAAILLGRVNADNPVQLICRGLGFARESETIESGTPLRGEGMVEAVRAALASASVDLSQVDYRIADLSGEQYGFKEAALAITRILRERKVDFGIWHPADCIGQVGAAALPAMLGVLFFGAGKRYLPGPIFLAHLSNDDEKRAALVISARTSS